MANSGERVESREPEDRVTEPGVDHCDLRARIVRKPDERRKLNAREERYGVALEPRASDGGNREREEQDIEPPLNHLRGEAHPASDLRKVRLCVDQAPQHAHHGEREHAHSQCFVELPVEISGD